MFYKLQNADAKVWLLPDKNLRTALQLYQPSGAKGKLLKRLLPLLHRSRFVRAKAGIVLENYSLPQSLLEKASKVFDIDIERLQYSVFLGTPSVHQKTTIQFFIGNRILGYAKLSPNPDIVDLFFHEQKILDFLHSHGISNVPECLLCEKASDGSGVFFQSTRKTLKSYSPAVWRPEHQQFLQNLYAETHRLIPFEESDFYASILRLQEIVPSLPEELQPAVSRNIHSVISENKGKTVDYSVWHADFTPWNMFFNGNRLFVFDWEYAQLTFPPFLDKYHFFTQQLIHVSHLTPDQILDEFNRQEWFDKENFRLYLLAVISLFLSREKGNISRGLLENLKTWVTLLNSL